MYTVVLHLHGHYLQTSRKAHSCGAALCPWFTEESKERKGVELFGLDRAKEKTPEAESEAWVRGERGRVVSRRN